MAGYRFYQRRFAILRYRNTIGIFDLCTYFNGINIIGTGIGCSPFDLRNSVTAFIGKSPSVGPCHFTTFYLHSIFHGAIGTEVGNGFHTFNMRAVHIVILQRDR